jgi:hypothetical protein
MENTMNAKMREENVTTLSTQCRRQDRLQHARNAAEEKYEVRNTGPEENCGKKKAWAPAPC